MTTTQNTQEMAARLESAEASLVAIGRGGFTADSAIRGTITVPVETIEKLVAEIVYGRRLAAAAISAERILSEEPIKGPALYSPSMQALRSAMAAHAAAVTR